MSTELRRQAVLGAVTRIADGVAGLLGIEDLTRGQIDLSEKLARVLQIQEAMMADFTEFNAKLDDQAAALADAQQRIDEDVQALQDQIADLELDTADQEAVNAAVEKLRASTDVLRGIDPVKPADVPVVDPGAEPTA